MSQESPSTTQPKPSAVKQAPLWLRILKGIGSLKLAVILLSFLLVLTYLGTIEQQEIGLYQAQKRYFDSWYLFHNLRIGLPDADPWFSIPLLLPGAYLVSGILFFNLLAGGVLTMRKGIRQIGILISHLGILFLLLAGVVSHHASRRGYITISEGERADAAVEYLDPQIEITELTESGKAEKVHVISPEHLHKLSPEASVLFHLENLPFNLRITSFLENAVPASIHEVNPPKGTKFFEDDTYYLLPRELDTTAEANHPACLARLEGKDGSNGETFILFDGPATYFPKTVSWDGKDYLVALERERWVLPFAVGLDKFKAEFFPGTRRPKSFESWVKRYDDKGEHPVHIEMNKPMRAEGLIFYQADWGPKDAAPGDQLYSKLEVVSNPADKWPEQALWVIAIGLLIHFGWMLISFVIRSTKPKPATKSS